MEEYEFDLTPQDLGEIIIMIRVQVLKMHVRPFADRIGVKEKVLLMTEEGRGPHGAMIMKKIAETFPSVLSVKMTLRIK